MQSDETLGKAFDIINEYYFNNKLKPIPIIYNNRLTRPNGKFFRKIRIRDNKVLVCNIQIATMTKKLGVKEIIRTLKHEMIHYYLYSLNDKKYSYHNDRFKFICDKIGAGYYGDSKSIFISDYNE